MNNKQVLKEIYFKNENKFFNKKSKFISYTCKSTTQILSNIASKNEYSEIRKRYKITLLLSKILLKSHFNFISYAYYRNNILVIIATNHIGQSELNLQKITIMGYLKKTISYKNVLKVSILRDEYKISKRKESQNTPQVYDEKSYGIFTNNLSNKALYAITERIRKKIILNK
jgi:CRISPR/Cas system-associated protein Cas5 (RAMP superfamily)